MDNKTKADGKMAVNNWVEYFHRPAFRKLFFHDINYFAVRIPTDFVDLLGEEVPDTATLSVSSGVTWQIKLVKGDDGISLEDGWQKFRDDNSLSPGEILLFRYSQNWSFDVQIFSPDGWERNIGDLGEKGKGIQQSEENFFRHVDKIKIEDSGENEEAGPSVVPRKPGRPRKQNDSGTEANNTGRANWKDRGVAQLFLDLCLKEVAGCCSNKGTLTSMPWEKIRLALKEEKHIDFTEKQLRNRWNNQKRMYTIWSKLVASAGTHYDPKENKINWSAHQWVEHFKINPEAVQFAHRSLEHPKVMMILFDD